MLSKRISELENRIESLNKDLKKIENYINETYKKSNENISNLNKVK